MGKFAVVGAGFSGAIISRQLALADHEVHIYESRNHVGGNCHTYRDSDFGIMIHAYGPHIFHTNNDFIWEYINQFDYFYPFINRVKAVSNNRVYSLPINLLTINNFFGKSFLPKEAIAFIKEISESGIKEPKSFEEQALKFLGKELYEAFFKGYTQKQWGISPALLPASILKRLPVRFDYNDNYYSSKYQGIPQNGYTYIVEKMIDVKGVKLFLNTSFVKSMLTEYEHVFYSGPIDKWFEKSQGSLAYRTLDFVQERHSGDYQGNPVINYCDYEIPWTRISEHKHFSPWEQHSETIIFKEYSRACTESDIPYYPIRLVDDKDVLSKYVRIANEEKKVTFVGRLGTYRYLDMHITIEEAYNVAQSFIELYRYNKSIPSFFNNPF